MGSAPTGYNTPKTNWQAADIVQPADMNRIEGNIQAVEEGNRTIDPAQVPTSNVGSLRQFLDWFANRIKAITGKPNWYDAPSKTLEDLNAHINNTNNPHNTTYSQVGAAPASHTHTPSQISPQGAGSGLDADTVDGLHASSFASNSYVSKSVIASDTVRYTAATERSYQRPNNGSQYVTVKQFQIYSFGNFRIKGEIRTYNSSYPARVQVLVNGVASSAFTTYSTSYVTFTIDSPSNTTQPISTIEVQLGANEGHIAYIRNVTLCFDFRSEPGVLQN